MSSPDFPNELPDRDSGGLMRQRPMGIVVAGIVLCLFGCVGLLVASYVLLTVFFVHTPQTVHHSVRVFQVTMMTFLFLISTFALFVVVGLFRMRRWARIGILILGALLAVYYGVLAIVVGVGAIVHPSHTAPGSSGSITLFLFALTCLLLLLALIGVWWLVYFNLRRIRQMFEKGGVAAEPNAAATFPRAGLPSEEGR